MNCRLRSRPLSFMTRIDLRVAPHVLVFPCCRFPVAQCPATGNVVNDDTIPFLNFPKPGPPATICLQGSRPAIFSATLGALSKVFAIDRSNVAATNRRRFCFNYDLAMPGFRDGKVSKFYTAVSKKHRHHCVTHLYIWVMVRQMQIAD